MKPLEPGIIGTAETKVDEETTALTVGSGSLEVFATPAMIALMEQAACLSVEACLSDAETTVGTLMSVRHLKATPCGRNVRAESMLEKVDDKRLFFSVKAWDGADLIGQGTHERFIVDIDAFMNKLQK